MDYLKLLESSYEYSYRELDINKNKYIFLSEQIFNFVTYDNNISEFLGKKALEVCIAITDEKIFKYIEKKENYIWFLTMCNMNFFMEKIYWIKSIRYSLWNFITENKMFKIDSCGIYNEDGVQIIEPLVFDKEQWKEFIYAMKKFVESK